MKFFRELKLRQWVLGLGLVALVATTASAARSRLYIWNITKLSGVDISGSADDDLGGKGPGKVYKDPASGILYQITNAIVINDFDRNRLFANRGLTILDPTSGTTRTATSDLEVVTLRTIRFGAGVLLAWRAAEIRVYDPSLDTTSTTSN